MGIFGGKAKQLGPRQLKHGAGIKLVDVDPGFVEWIRSAKPVHGRSHHATVRVDLEGSDIVVRAGDGGIVARMDPEKVPLYVNEFQILHSRGHYGVCEIEVSRADLVERYELLINYDEHCRDGGIL